jgi:branched-chain amino acid transport system ATP-binding protein
MRIELRTVYAGYVADVPILNGVSFTVEDREIVTIVGPNGSGKSTVLRALMGYMRLFSGQVLLDGESVTRAAVHERVLAHGIAYVPQRNNVFGPLTVRENLEMGGVRLSHRQRQRRIAELLDLYPVLGERMHQRADSQSGGERQMLAVARALMTRPRCLLLDEPSAGLAPLMSAQLFEMLVDLRTRESVTVLVIEQNAAQSLAVSDRGVLLVLGRVALEGPTESLLEDSRLSELYFGGAPEASAADAQSEVS